jgi:hypothetical protein
MTAGIGGIGISIGTPMSRNPSACSERRAARWLYNADPAGRENENVENVGKLKMFGTYDSFLVWAKAYANSTCFIHVA